MKYATMKKEVMKTVIFTAESYSVQEQIKNSASCRTQGGVEKEKKRKNLSGTVRSLP
jgi:hypothetical protein